MLAGQLPWGPNAAPALVMMRIVSHAPPAPSSLNPGLSPAVDAVFDRVLAKRPAGRYESCGAFAAALREALLPTLAAAFSDAPTIVESQPILASPAPAPAPAPAQTPRRSGLLVLLFLFLGVNSVVLALVDWDKLGTRLPWDTSSAPPSAR